MHARDFRGDRLSRASRRSGAALAPLRTRCESRWSRPRSFPFRRLATAEPSSSSPSWSTALAAAGHEVTLFATGDSRPPAGIALRARFRACRVAARRRTSSSSTPPSPSRRSSPTRAASTWCTRTCRRRCRSRRMLERRSSTRCITPMARDYDAAGAAVRAQPRALRRHQRAAAAAHPRARAMPASIHHGLDRDALSARRRRRRLRARFSAASRARRGRTWRIDVARAAGRADPPRRRAALGDHDYFEREIGARLCAPGVTARRRARRRRQARLPRRARWRSCFPIDWEEPFGLVMIEAMLCGHAGARVRARLGARDRRRRRDRLGLRRRRGDGGAAAQRIGRLRSRGAAAARALERLSVGAHGARLPDALRARAMRWVGDVRAAETRRLKSAPEALARCRRRARPSRWCCRAATSSA